MYIGHFLSYKSGSIVRLERCWLYWYAPASQNHGQPHLPKWPVFRATYEKLRAIAEAMYPATVVGGL